MKSNLAIETSLAVRHMEIAQKHSLFAICDDETLAKIMKSSAKERENWEKYPR